MVPSRRASLGIRDDEVVILLARRLVEKNGVVWFARAVDRLRGSPVRIVVAGEGGERPAMEKILSENGMLDRTIFLGSVVERRHAGALSCRRYFGAAIACGSNEHRRAGSYGVGRSARGHKRGRHSGHHRGQRDRALDPAAGSGGNGRRHLARLVVDQALRRQMGAAARAKVEREFTWTQVVRRTIDVYRASLGAAHP